MCGNLPVSASVKTFLEKSHPYSFKLVLTKNSVVSHPRRLNAYMIIARTPFCDVSLKNCSIFPAYHHTFEAMNAAAGGKYRIISCRIVKNEFFGIMKDRIKQVMEYARLSQQDFAARLGISPASLSSIYTGRTNPTNNHVSAIHRAFPEINVNWVMFGEGEMLIPNTVNDSTADDEHSTEKNFAESPVSVDVGGVNDGRTLSLFPHDELVAMSASTTMQNHVSTTPRPSSPAHRALSQTTPQNADLGRPVRKVKEIRVFFDDGTYESFVPSGK